MIDKELEEDGSDELNETPSFADIFNDWVVHDVDLAGHFFLEYNIDGLHVYTTCTDTKVAWISADGTVSQWPHLSDEAIHFTPADPKFFDEVRTHLLDAHNSKTMRTPRGNTWHTKRLGCTIVL